jgi:uncharacterized membrane protein
MEVGLVLLALVPIALLILLIMNIGRLNSVNEEMRLMRLQMQELMKSMAHQQRTRQAPLPEQEPEVVRPPIITPPPRYTPPPAPEPTPVIPEPPRHEWVEEPVDFSSFRPTPVPEPEPPPPPIIITPPPARIPVVEPIRRTPPPPPRPSFLERNPDLEKFIGENLINKIGIAILVIGLGLLLKFAIGKNMISETGRTLIGIGSGALLLFVAHRLREKFRAFSSVLVGGGLAVLYFSVSIAFRDYGIIGQTPAFLVLVGITAIGILLTLVYDRRELAVIALLGGFASPFMASTGAGNYQVLFSYLLVLNVGMLVLANYKKWHIINIISFVLTVIIYGGWLGTKYMAMDPHPVWPALLFASGFFVVFFSMNLRYNLRHGEAFGPLDFSLLLANTAAYYTAGMVILDGYLPRLNGLFTLAVALFHLGFAVFLHKRANAPRHLVYLLIGLVLTFVSLAAPVQLHGNYITLFWSLECVLLLWFSQRTGIRLVERASLLVGALMLISLHMDLSDHYLADPLTRLAPLLNKPWITGMVAAVALYLYGKLCERLPADRAVLAGFSPRDLRNTAWVLCILVLFFTNFLEVNHQLGYHFEGGVVRMALTAYTLGFGVALYFLSRGAGRNFSLAITTLLVGVLLYYITGFYASSIGALLDLRTGSGGGGVGPFHIMSALAALAALWCIARAVRDLVQRPSKKWDVYLWSMCIFLLIFCSQELDHVMLLFVKPATYDVGLENWVAGAADARYALMDALSTLRKAGYPILWGLGSFALMWYGMRTRQRTVRIIGLSLFGFTLLKLFLYDLGSISEGGKVAAFICLGILLLVVSFMYNKLKGLLKEDDVTRGPMPPTPPQEP